MLDDEKNNIVTTNAITLNNKNLCLSDKFSTANFLNDLSLVIPTAIAENTQGINPHNTVIK